MSNVECLRNDEDRNKKVFVIVSFLRASSVDRGKNQVQFLGFFPVSARLFFQFRYGGRNHAQPVLALSGLSLADADAVSELFLRPRIVRLAIVSADARRRTTCPTSDSVTEFLGIVFANRMIASPNFAVLSSRS